ncbi:UBP-type zinc finger domain-containing protein [Saccharopolyspora sp. CA-218241]|uniref:UBP-type zinc finger domain-containing protein n=1 Tax=Saccharopolyspora sp. CA-218241 TaxID=3240027 RepID=UPI003D964476
MARSCAHLRGAAEQEPPERALDRCEDCAAIGADVWAHLRQCLECGHVGCCDSSPHRHATGHFRESGHPVIRSFEPGEAWRWCYLDELIG